MPGHKSDNVPVEINDYGVPSDQAGEDDDSVVYGAVPLEEDGMAAVRAISSKLLDVRVTRKDTEKHSATPGRPACRHSLGNSRMPRGVGHPAVCRKRIRELVEINEGTCHLVGRADQRRKKRADAVGSMVADKRPSTSN